MKNTLQFNSTISVFLTYLILRVAPLVAVVYYFFTWQWAIIVGLILLIAILIHSAYTNHNFSLDNKRLQISPSIPLGQKVHTFDYTSIKFIQIKYAKERENVQWLAVHLKNASKPIRFRCDWLHVQDPPDEDEDDHGQLEHELFELLEDEDFYDGSLQQLSDELRKRGLNIQEV